MRKNILSVLILALLVVNIALTGIMMFSVTSTNKKTAALIDNIATVMNLELTVPGEDEVLVSLADTVTHDMVGEMTIPLSGGEKQSYIMFSVSLLMNVKGEGYKDYGETIGERESLIKDAITSVVSKYTEAECRNDFDAIKEEMLESIQKLFQSDFIYKIAINGIKYG
ncbi:MAG: flagellar basal body-associated FliL family protein [Lachnospiraceae bacterium]|nr:flagellar basal body-associated FliL family protein [Lachnospiraceae bacterium]